MTRTKWIFSLTVLAMMGFISSSVQAHDFHGMETISLVRPVKIESAVVLPEGRLAVDAGLAYEMDREWVDREYDNIRFAPFGIRYGVAPDIEIGAYLGYSSNDEDDDFAPDDSGLEGISIFGKLQINRFSSVTVGLTFAGDDDVFPYPNDELDLFANLALRRTIGNGILYGEFGYTTQGGDLDFNDYLNYGIGYVFPLTDHLGMNVELIGEEDHYGTFGNTLDLLLGGNMTLAKGFRLAPYVTFGLNDASPDFSIGSFLEMRF